MLLAAHSQLIDTLSHSRYARTGNCNMGAFKDEAGEIDWLTPTLEDVRISYCCVLLFVSFVSSQLISFYLTTFIVTGKLLL